MIIMENHLFELKGAVDDYLKKKIKKKNIIFTYLYLMIYLGLKLL